MNEELPLRPNQEQIAKIMADPSVTALRHRQKQLLEHILVEVGRETDNFVAECLKLAYPGFISNLVEKFYTEPSFQQIFLELLQATLFSVEDVPDLDKTRPAKIRAVFIGRERSVLGRLVIYMENGRLKVERSLNESLKASGQTVYSASDKSVRLFLWRACHLGISRASARNRYQLYYGTPEDRAEDIDYNRIADFLVQNQRTGIEQRPEPSGG